MVKIWSTPVKLVKLAKLVKLVKLAKLVKLVKLVELVELAPRAFPMSSRSRGQEVVLPGVASDYWANNPGPSR